MCGVSVSFFVSLPLSCLRDTGYGPMFGDSVSDGHNRHNRFPIFVVAVAHRMASTRLIRIRL